MLFNSGQFLFLFLPVVLAVFFYLGVKGWRLAAAGWLALASLAFYGWHHPFKLIPIILISAGFNYWIGVKLSRRPGRLLLTAGIAANLALLAYFKYAAFIVDNVAPLIGVDHSPIRIALPIGISFYTFTQIAFLVDAARGKARETGLVHYLLFVTYFPHLIAGPILHHSEMMPQFRRTETYLPRWSNFVLGASWFAAGLFKKTVLADGVAIFAGPAFTAAAQGHAPGMADAWIGVLSYTLQIYFDFSGYTDMAIGLAKMMGIDFPVNFNSPYKAASIVDFWRRWHMTLSRFLRDYLYIPLGGNRLGPVRRHANLMVTMLLGGLWHGASWNFVLWGGIHGAALVVNHLWRHSGIGLPRFAGWLLTLLVVMLAWVPFRADSLPATMVMWRSLFNPVSSSTTSMAEPVLWIAGLFAIALLLPNMQQLLGGQIRRPLPSWRPSVAWALVFGAGLGLGIAAMEMQNASQFLYFRF